MQIAGTKRPHPNLLKYYVLESLLLGPLFPLLLLPRYFRYRSLAYTFDDQGISMRWGVLFHRQVSLTYARIQDIHLESNLVERRLGLARIKIQTAAGAATPEMAIEGLTQFSAVRDLLYSRMRGARGLGRRTASERSSAADTNPSTEAAAVLREVVAEIRSLRAELSSRNETRDER